MGEGYYITLFSPSDVTAFHRMKYGGGGCYITLFPPSDITAFHIIMWSCQSDSDSDFRFRFIYLIKESKYIVI